MPLTVCARAWLRLADCVAAGAASARHLAPAAALDIRGGVIVAALAPPMDTIKTGQQGDVTQKTYQGVVHAGVEITGTTSRRWRGAPEI